MKARGGNLGTGLLQRFNVAFDYSRAAMHLSRNKAFGKPFEWDMSGLWLDPDEKGALRVAFIVTGSAAEAAGLRIGDILTRVDDRAVAAGDLRALRQRFREGDGTFAMTLARDGQPVEATLRLKRLV